MNKQNQILLAVLAVQIALIAAVFWPRAAASGAESGPIFPDFKAADVTTLTISDSEGQRVALAKKGDSWVLPEADDFPAQADTITDLLAKIEAVKTNRLVTRTEASHKRLKVAGDDFNRLLELTLSGGGSHKLFVGSSGGAGATHVRADDQSEVFLTGELTPWEVNADPSRWIDTLYFTLPQTATVALTLENENGVFEFEKEGETWTMKNLAKDETLNADSVTTLVNLASSVRMTAPVGKQEQALFGFDAPRATLTLKTAAQTYTLQVGAQNPNDENSYFFKASNSPYYVRVAAFTGDSFVNKTRADFLQAPPTPEPEATATP